jgi:hypothetical protein
VYSLRAQRRKGSGEVQMLEVERRDEVDEEVDEFEETTC